MKTLPNWTPRKLTLALEQIPIHKPIFLLGTHGGGLTVLARVLHRHSDLVYCHGNSSFWAYPDEMQNVGFDDLSPNLRLVPVGKNATDFDHPEFGGYRGFNYAVESLFEHYRLKDVDFQIEEAEQLRNLDTLKHLGISVKKVHPWS